MLTSGTTSNNSRRNRPPGYWSTFNAWWKALFERTKRRPTSQAIKCWHSRNATRVWGSCSPTYEQLQRHANCHRAYTLTCMQQPDLPQDGETSNPRHHGYGNEALPLAMSRQQGTEEAEHGSPCDGASRLEARDYCAAQAPPRHRDPCANDPQTSSAVPHSSIPRLMVGARLDAAVRRCSRETPSSAAAVSRQHEGPFASCRQPGLHRASLLDLQEVPPRHQLASAAVAAAAAAAQEEEEEAQQQQQQAGRIEHALLQLLQQQQRRRSSTSGGSSSLATIGHKRALELVSACDEQPSRRGGISGGARPCRPSACAAEAAEASLSGAAHAAPAHPAPAPLGGLLQRQLEALQTLGLLQGVSLPLQGVSCAPSLYSTSGLLSGRPLLAPAPDPPCVSVTLPRVSYPADPCWQLLEALRPPAEVQQQHQALHLLVSAAGGSKQLPITINTNDSHSALAALLPRASGHWGLQPLAYNISQGLELCQLLGLGLHGSRP